MSVMVCIWLYCVVYLRHARTGYFYCLLRSLNSFMTFRLCVKILVTLRFEIYIVQVYLKYLVVKGYVYGILIYIVNIYYFI